MGSKIEWTDETWNPVTGCTKVSPGCKHCYAERVSKRWGKTFTNVKIHSQRLHRPLSWRKPRMVFTCSMSDLFHERVPDVFLDSVFDVMAQASRHTFQVLTKRIVRARDWLRTQKIPDNVWIGTSCEDQDRYDERMPVLMEIDAPVRFLSMEPLLGDVDMCLHANYKPDWVIVGGESGPGARPMAVDWALRILKQCDTNGVPFFMKQMGGWPNKRGSLDDIPLEVSVREFPGGERLDK